MLCSPEVYCSALAALLKAACWGDSAGRVRGTSAAINPSSPVTLMHLSGIVGQGYLESRIREAWDDLDFSLIF